MDDGHGGKSDPYGCGGGGIDLADKVSICHIIEAGAQHADDGGQRQGSDQRLHRSFQHFLVFLGFFGVFGCRINHKRTAYLSDNGRVFFFIIP